MRHLLNKNLQQFFHENYFVNSFTFTIRGKSERFTDTRKSSPFQQQPSSRALVTPALGFPLSYNPRVNILNFDSNLAPFLIQKTCVKYFHCSHNCLNSNINSRRLRFLKMVDSISDMIITPCEKSKYIKPLRLHYKQVKLIYIYNVHF